MSDRLEQVFEHKRKSSAEFRAVQRKNGLILTPDDMTADPNTREGAIELHKSIHWFNLELWEFMCTSTDERPEELADVLHFLVELTILAGLDHTVVPEWEDCDRLDVMLQASLQDPWVLPDADANARFSIVAGLRLANLLKNKPWKQTLKEIDRKELTVCVAAMFFWYGATVRTSGLSAEDLFQQFVRKEDINHTRVTTGV